MWTVPAAANWHHPDRRLCAEHPLWYGLWLRDEQIMSPGVFIRPVVHTLTCANIASDATSRTRLAAYLSSSRV